jgi:predicted AAA+ superfamily ATPase
MKRYLENSISNDLNEKIVILSGPRQVGKTTLSKQLRLSYVYLNYDSRPDRKTIKNEEWPRDVELIIFDELHKLKKWKSWIKGIFDKEGVSPQLLITGSARLDTVKKGGDSLAGRFFSYRLHPLSVKEIHDLLKEDAQTALSKLLSLGGFPEPYLKNSETWAKRWRRTHMDTILREDLIDLEKVRDIKAIEILLDLLRVRVGATTSYASLANDLQVSIHTIKHWLQILEDLFVIFPVRPYAKNIARSILKESKYYFYDTGAIEGDLGAKLENTVALALLKEIHFLEDITGSNVALHYLRDKEKHEVDFLVVIDNQPALLIEAKLSDDTFAKSLFRFQAMLPSAVAVQLVMNLRQRKEKDGIKMHPAAEFLANLTLQNKIITSAR